MEIKIGLTITFIVIVMFVFFYGVINSAESITMIKDKSDDETHIENEEEDQEESDPSWVSRDELDPKLKLFFDFCMAIQGDKPILFEDEVKYFGHQMWSLEIKDLYKMLGYSINEEGGHTLITPLPTYSAIGELLRLNRHLFYLDSNEYRSIRRELFITKSTPWLKSKNKFIKKGESDDFFTYFFYHEIDVHSDEQKLLSITYWGEPQNVFDFESFSVNGVPVWRLIGVDEEPKTRRRIFRPHVIRKLRDHLTKLGEKLPEPKF